MAEQQHPAPKGGVIAYLMVEGAQKAADFYKKAFGAEIAFINPPDEKGRTMHAHVYINGSSVMLSDPFPEQNCSYVPAAGFSLMLPVQDVDGWWQKAVDAGMTGNMPPMDMFWGDRYAQAKDGFGIQWAFVGPKKG
ncbi:MAG: VOC family protein [Alphaproteobacteria bacterium]